MKWPLDMGNELSAILRDELIDACNTFPDYTGLGWDCMHPKCIARL